MWGLTGQGGLEAVVWLADMRKNRITEVLSIVHRPSPNCCCCCFRRLAGSRSQRGWEIMPLLLRGSHRRIWITQPLLSP